MLDAKKIVNIPKTTGIYIFKDKSSQIIYVGKALNLNERINSYFQKQDSFKNELLIKEITDCQYIEVFSEVEALILEANLIKLYQPKYNVLLKDDKSFLYIVITNEKFPRILACRRSEKNIPLKYQYGPYPSSNIVRDVLKLLRKVFPYCTQKPEASKPCFYSHLGLCNPCPSVIEKENKEKYYLLRREYLTNINNIKKILEGKVSPLLGQLYRELDNKRKSLRFEEAQETLTKIKKLEYITRPYYKIRNFLDDSNFLQNQKKKALSELFSILKPYYPNLNKLRRIEGIDVSNIMGEQATGSLVVFLEGQKTPSLYKRFKIKTTGPNDVSMLDETVKRRFTHKEWDFPDLLVVDGGKSQVSQIKKSLANLKINRFPFIGLAKHNETVIIPFKNNFSSLTINRESNALRLIQEIRDEAHRFAIKYHQYLRKKTLQLT